MFNEGAEDILFSECFDDFDDDNFGVTESYDDGAGRGYNSSSLPPSSSFSVAAPAATAVPRSGPGSRGGSRMRGPGRKLSANASSVAAAAAGSSGGGSGTLAGSAVLKISIPASSVMTGVGVGAVGLSSSLAALNTPPVMARKRGRPRRQPLPAAIIVDPQQLQQQLSQDPSSLSEGDGDGALVTSVDESGQRGPPTGPEGAHPHVMDPSTSPRAASSSFSLVDVKVDYVPGVEVVKVEGTGGGGGGVRTSFSPNASPSSTSPQHFGLQLPQLSLQMQSLSQSLSQPQPQQYIHQYSPRQMAENGAGTLV